ncbi:MAG: tetratricopeptide repeat protein [Bacteroidia bacterium]|nr:tetratricopeptide repeat protein [Bacteroidia bacterium]
MKKKITWLFLLLIWIPAYPQAVNPDILESQLKNATTQPERMHLLKELAFELKSNDTEKALTYARESLYLANKLNDEHGIAEAHHTIGLINRYKGEYDDALDHFLKAMEIRKTINDEVGLARSYNNIGQISDLQGNLEDALNYYRKSLELRTRNRDSVGMVYSYISIGEVYEKQEDYETALSSYADALILAKKVSDEKGQTFAHTRMGNLFWKMEMYGNARSHYQDALDISTKLNSKYDISLSNIGLARIFIQEQNFEKALPLLEEGLRLAKETRALDNIRDAYQGLSEISYLKKDFKQAFYYQELYTEMKDSLFNQNKSESISAIQARHELEKKEHEIEELKRNQDISRLRNFAFLGISAGFFLLVVLIVILYRYRIQTHTNLLLSTQKQEIETKNHELEMSNRELEDFAHAVSHDLKQPLRTIGSYTGLIQKRYGHELGEEGKEYIEFIRGGVTRLHSLLSDLLVYSNVGETEAFDQQVKMDDLMRSVLVNLDQQIRDTGAMIFIGQMPGITGNYSALLQLFQNLISNSMKFQAEGNKPNVNVTHRLFKDFNRFEVKDNGIGIPPEYQEKIFKAFHRLHTQEEYPGSGIGLAICQKVVQLHGGEISVCSTPNKGSSFFVDLPLTYTHES